METSVAPAMPCKNYEEELWEWWDPTKIETRFACILEADESTRTRVWNSKTALLWRPCCRKRSITALRLDSQNLFLCLKLWKFLQQRQRWTRNGKNWRKFRRETWRKSEVRKRWSMKQGRRAQKFMLPHWWTCHLKNAELEAKHQKYKGRAVLRGDFVKDDSGVLRSIHWTRIISISNDSRQNHGCHLQITRLRWTGSRRSTSLYPGEYGRCSKIIELSQSEMSRQFGFVYHDTNHGPVWKTQSFLLNEICNGHPLAGLLWERQFEKVLLKHGWEKIPNLGMSLCTSWKRIILINVYGWHKIGWKETNIDPMWKSTQPRSWFGRTNILY